MKRTSLSLIAIAVLGCIALYMAFLPDSGSLDTDLGTHFAIEDTSRVTRIRIADAQGHVASLERGDHPLGLWTLNGERLARKDATDLLLKTFKRVTVRQPVQQKAKEGVLRMMASSGKRVDIHLDGEDQPTKTWFIGTPTQSHTGTHMLLELPGSGRSDTPYITHMEGFTGFLSTRFFTSEQEWRYTGVYESRPGDIASISARPLDDVGRAATLEWSPDGETLTVSGDFQSLEVPQGILRDQWLRMCDVHIETWDSHLSTQQEDSLSQSQPAWQLDVRYKDGRHLPMTVYWKAPIMEEYDLDGTLMEHDGSRMYAIVHGEVALIQTFVFNPILDFWRNLASVDSPSAS